jgi:hypothetical protein
MQSPIKDRARSETMVQRPQQLLALDRANEIRRVRSQLKRRISAGQLSAIEVILACPVEVETWPLAELLACQRTWGPARARKFLARTGISEIKPLGELTVRQRRLLADELSGRGRPKI